MKKIFAVIFVLLLVVSTTLTTWAANGSFVSSPSNHMAPILINAENVSEGCTAKITITAYADREELGEQKKNMLVDAYWLIANAEDLGTLSTDIGQLADELGISSHDFAVSDLFDISYSGCEQHENHYIFTITIKPTSVENFVAMLHYTGADWEVIEGTVEEDEIIFVSEDLSPFAIMVNAGDSDVQPTADFCPCIIAIFLLFLLVLLIVWLMGRKKKTEDEEPKQ